MRSYPKWSAPSTYHITKMIYYCFLLSSDITPQHLPNYKNDLLLLLVIIWHHHPDPPQHLPNYENDLLLLFVIIWHHYYHYEKTPIQLKISPPKTENFQIKKTLIFFIFLEWKAVLMYPQSLFLSRNNKNNVYPCKPQFYYIKVGFKGVKII